MSKKSTNTNSSSKSEIETIQQQVITLEENWKRALADYQNLVRRVDHDRTQFIKLANTNLISRLIPSLDILELSAAHSQDTGVNLAAKQFHQALDEEGLQVIQPEIGTSFDPQFHECSEIIESTQTEKNNTIGELILKGYKLGDYVLRPAKVKVIKLALDK